MKDGDINDRKAELMDGQPLNRGHPLGQRRGVALEIRASKRLMARPVVFWRAAVIAYSRRISLPQFRATGEGASKPANAPTAAEPIETMASGNFAALSAC